MHCHLQKGACFCLKKLLGLIPHVGKAVTTSFHSMSQSPNFFRLLLLSSSAISDPCGAAAAAAYRCDLRCVLSGSNTSLRAGQWGAQTGAAGAAFPPDEHDCSKKWLLFSVPAVCSDACLWSHLEALWLVEPATLSLCSYYDINPYFGFCG